VTLTESPMPTFDQGDVVRVPFPYTDRPVKQHRPALVISMGGTGERGRLLWVLMVTSAENRPWTGDVHLGTRYAEAGLPAPSVVRTAKVATIESAHADRIGRLDDDLLNRVLASVRPTVGC
jgi:mRNA interferase MazF